MLHHNRPHSALAATNSSFRPRRGIKVEAEELLHHFRPPLLPPPYQPVYCCVAGGGAGGQYTHTYVQTDTHTQSHRPPHCVMHEGTMCSRWTLRRNTCSGTVDMQAPVVCAYRFTQWLCVCVPVCLSVLLLKRFAVSLFNEQLSLSFRSGWDMHGAYFWTWRKAKTLQRPEQFALTTLSVKTIPVSAETKARRGDGEYGRLYEGAEGRNSRGTHGHSLH